MHLKVKGRLKKANHFALGVRVSQDLSLKSVSLRVCTMVPRTDQESEGNHSHKGRTKEKPLAQTLWSRSSVSDAVTREKMRNGTAPGPWGRLPAQGAADLQGDHWFIFFLVSRFHELQGTRILVFLILLRLANRSSNFLQGMTDRT